MRPLRYAESPPPRELAAHVHSCWSFEARLPPGESMSHHIWPDGCVSLAVAIHDARPVAVAVVGPGTRAQRVPVRAGIRHRGVRFWPDTGGAALGVDPASLRDRMVPLAELLGRDALDDAMRHAQAVAAATDDAAVRGAFAAWLAPVRALPVDTRVRDAVRRLVDADGELAIASLAREVGLGPRQLQRRFGRAVGLTPKEYARVRRVRAAIAGVQRGEDRWAQLAHSLGYADQAHMVREMGEMTGLTPGAVEGRLEAIEHENVVP
jgi:AraC-like DNA-binding protein